MKRSLSTSLLTTILMLLSAGLCMLAAYILYVEWLEFQEDSERIRTTYLRNTRSTLKNDVTRAISLISYEQAQAREELHQALTDHATQAREQLQHLYTLYGGDLENDALKALLLDSLRPTQFSLPARSTGYFTLGDLDGELLLTPRAPSFEGRQSWNIETASGDYPIRRIVRMLDHRDGGLVSYDWPAETSGAPEKRITGYFTLFAPLGWYIGATVDIRDYTHRVQERTLSLLASTFNESQPYLFAGTWDGLSLLGPARGTNVYDIEDDNGVKVVRELIAQARSGGGFVEYVMPRLPGSSLRPKISYSRAVPDWEWYIGAGAMLDAIETAVAEQQLRLRETVLNQLQLFVLILCLFLGAGTVFAKLTTRRLAGDLQAFARFFLQSGKNSLRMDPEATSFVEFQSMAHSANAMLDARIQSEKALAASEATYRELFNASADGIFIYDIDSLALLDANTTGQHLYVATLTELQTGMGPGSMESRSNKGLSFNAMLQEAAKGAEQFGERIERQTNGRLFWAEIRIRPITINEKLRLHVSVRDISERKEKEEALENANALFTAMIEQAAYGITVAEAGPFAWRIRLANEQAARILGMDKAELSSMVFTEGLVADGHLMHYTLHDPMKAEEIPEMPPLARAAFREEKIVNKEYLVRRTKGGQSTILVNCAPVYGAGGDIIAAVNVFTDITERKEAENAIRRLSRLLQEIVDAMPSVLVGLDTELRVTLWNRSAEELTGVSQQEALGRLLHMLSPLLASQEHCIRRAMDSRSIQKRSKQPGVIGPGTLVDIATYPLLAEGVEGAVLQMDNVTQQANMEMLMVQTEKMLSVGGLAAGMAHEINNPLGVITQGVQNTIRRLSPDLPANLKASEKAGIDLENLQQYLKDRKIFSYLQSMRDAVDRTARIVSNMLTFSRQSEAEHSLTDVSTIIERTLELAANDYDLKRKLDFRSIQIVREFDRDLPTVPCSPMEIEQVLLNLLRNAAQALGETDQNAPCIILRTFREDSFVCIEVEDNGSGMDDTTLRRAFEPFYTTKEVGVGTGLGLSVSYFIITQNHNGLFQAHSSLGEWTRFTIKLPASRYPADKGV